MLHFFRLGSIFDLLKGHRFVTLIGAGGKTSLSECISKVYLEMGFHPVITVTTKIYAREPYLLEADLDETFLRSRRFVRIGGDLKDGKLLGVKEETLRTLGEFYDIVLIEGDGSKGRPLKYCGPDEPRIPDVTDLVIVVCGLDAFGKPVRDVVFRWQLLEGREGICGDEIVDVDGFLKIFMEGMFKVNEGMEYIICLNKYDLMSEKCQIWEITRRLAQKVSAPFLLISSAKFGIFYAFEVKELKYRFAQGEAPTSHTL